MATRGRDAAAARDMPGRGSRLRDDRAAERVLDRAVDWHTRRRSVRLPAVHARARGTLSIRGQQLRALSEPGAHRERAVRSAARPVAELAGSIRGSSMGPEREGSHWATGPTLL